MARKQPETIPPCSMDDPLPSDIRTLVWQVRTFAIARRRAADSHNRTCGCTGCYVRDRDASHAA